MALDAVIPEGKQLSLQLNESLSTEVNKEGDSFTAVVTTPFYSGDRVVIPKGSVVNGSVSRVNRPSRLSNKAQMNLRFQSIDIPGCGQIPIVATLKSFSGQGSSGIRIEGSEGSVGAKSPMGSDVSKIVLPAIVGGLLGNRFGKSTGAAIGIGAGITAGTIILFAEKKEIKIPSGATLVIELNKPLTIPVEAEAAAIRNR